MPRRTHLAWMLDLQRRAVLQLPTDGHLAHIQARQLAGALPSLVLSSFGTVAGADASDGVATPGTA